MGQVEGKDKADFSITALHAPSRGTTSALAAACSDGRLRLISYSGRLEKVTDAVHDGSVVCVSWNRNGTAVATGGEDGALKTWSSTGMIRATVAQGDKPIYSLAWSPDNSSVQLLQLVSSTEVPWHTLPSTRILARQFILEQCVLCRLRILVDRTCVLRRQNVQQANLANGRRWSHPLPRQGACYCRLIGVVCTATLSLVGKTAGVHDMHLRRLNVLPIESGMGCEVVLARLKAVWVATS